MAPYKLTYQTFTMPGHRDVQTYTQHLDVVPLPEYGAGNVPADFNVDPSRNCCAKHALMWRSSVDGTLLSRESTLPSMCTHGSVLGAPCCAVGWPDSLKPLPAHEAYIFHGPPGREAPAGLPRENEKQICDSLPTGFVGRWPIKSQQPAGRRLIALHTQPLRTSS